MHDNTALNHAASSIVSSGQKQGGKAIPRQETETQMKLELLNYVSLISCNFTQLP